MLIDNFSLLNSEEENFPLNYKIKEEKLQMHCTVISY